jgi:hypothetical protein
MVRDRRAAIAAALVLALVVVLEFLPALSLGFAGDDFELLSLARIGGFAPSALVLPHRGAFVKPVLNAAWAACASLFGANAGAWYTLALLVHLLDATLLGLLACRLAAAWGGSGVAGAGNASLAAAGPSAAPVTGTRAEAAGGRGEAGDGRGFPHAPVLTGLFTALLWAVHDRLSEPIFSIASLNHSLSFGFYLAAMLAAVAAIATREPRARLMAALFVLLTLFSYEVGASVLLALGLLALLAPKGAREPGAGEETRASGIRRRAAALGLPTAAAVFVWAAVQGVSRLAPGAVSYYTLSPALWLRNLAEIGLASLHIPSYRLEPRAVWSLPFAGALLAGALWPRLDRVARFGCAWALAACLPVLPIPFFSDRYHYIAFAGIAVALGRGAAILVARAVPADGAAAPALRRSRLGSIGAVVPVALSVTALLAVVHVVWSIAGAREQAAYYAFKCGIPDRLLEKARAADRGLSAQPPDALAVVWRGEPDLVARAFQQAEMGRLKPRFSEAHPLYVRPQGILGAVYPADLFNVAAADRGGFYRRPAPERAARALVEGSLRVVPMDVLDWGTPASPGLEAHLAESLRTALMTRREIPVTLPAEEGSSAPGWNVAWLEPTDRAGAFEAEYGPGAAASGAAPAHAAGAAGTPASR